VIPRLNKKGYTSIFAVENPLTSLDDDAERTRKMIAQRKGPVLLVGHSYGGAVITEAGNQPNVVGLVYIAAFAPEVGETVSSISKAFAAPGVGNLLPDSYGYLWIKQDKFHESFCQDLTAEEALVMAVTQKAPLVSLFGDKITAAAWKNKPSWYQISSSDRMLAPETEKMMSDRLGAKKVITLDASHASLASRPDEVTALIDEAANATQC
jgi:pimeloyl-ACP methyl ester carboxylesterase